MVTDTKNNVISLYATAAYVYDSRYILNFNIRTDGSNKFGQSKSVRFLPIWSVSTRWNVINEKFMKNVDFLNDLAIRASYGIQGNVHPDQTPNLIASLGTLESMPQEYISTLYKLPNNKLKWEKPIRIILQSTGHSGITESMDRLMYITKGSRSGGYEKRSSFYRCVKCLH